MSDREGVLVLAALVVCGCGYDRGWNEGSGDRDASFEAAPGRVVTEQPNSSDGGIPATTGRTCDLFAQDCGEGQGCYRTGCAGAGTVSEGATCTWDSDCVKGSLCDNGTAPARCRTICKNVDEDDCQQWCCLQHCVPVNDRRFPVETGVCRM
jgi:hypothetical protein